MLDFFIFYKVTYLVDHPSYLRIILVLFYIADFFKTESLNCSDLIFF